MSDSDDLDHQSEEIRGSRGKRDGDLVQHVGRDPRVTSASNWLMNLMQAIVALVLAFVANNLYQVNLTLAADAVSKQEIIRQLADQRARIERNEDKDERQEDHINAVDRRLVGVEQATGLNQRGARRDR